MHTLRLTSSAEDLSRAGRMLGNGALIAFPTETVYGLGANATDGNAVAGIYAAKGRPSFNPLIVHVASVDAARAFTHWNDDAQRLAAAFWPGPMTLVLPLAESSGLSELVTAGLSSVAVRVPAHATAQALLTAAGCPVAAPSANPSGQISPTTSQHVLQGLDGRIAAVVDDGPCSVGLESTIVGLTDTPRLLRPGGVPLGPISAALGKALAPAKHGISAPGQLASHYAPKPRVRLEVAHAAPGESHLGFGDITGDLNLSEAGDLREAAANLFGHLHKLDGVGKPIAVAPIPEKGLGVAINDRLRRAAAPRD